MIHFLYGEDDYRSRQRLAQIKKDFKAKHGGMNLFVFDKESDFDEIKRSILTMSFFGKKKMVILENMILERDRGDQEKIKKMLEEKNIPDSVDLIFWERGLPPQNNELFKMLLKQKCERFDLLFGWRLSKWIEDEVKKRGGAIEKETVQKLASFVGNNLWQMSGEIDKLLAYQGLKKGKVSKINSEDINLLVKAKLDENIFNLTNAIGRKDAKKAITLLYDQIALGQHPVYLLKMITFQFRNLLLVKDLQEKGEGASKISDKAHLHPYVVEKTLPQCQNFSLSKLKKIYQKLLDTDIVFKKSKLDPSLALSLLIVSFCS